MCRLTRLAGTAAVRSRKSAGDGVAGEGGFDGPERAERVEWLDEPSVGVGLLGEEHVDLSVEQQEDGSVVEIAHLDALFDGHACRHAAHGADLEIQQDERRIDLENRRNHVDPRPDPVDQVGAAQGGLDVVGEPVGVGGEKDVRHEAKSYTGAGRVWHGKRWGYDAPVLEIIANRSDDGSQVDLCPAGELDAYSVAQFREAFAEMADEPRVVVNLSGVQFMDSAGLGALIGGIRRIRESDGRVVIFSDREAITKLLHTTGFDRIVPVKDDYGEAVAALDEDPDA